MEALGRGSDVGEKQALLAPRNQREVQGVAMVKDADIGKQNFNLLK